MTKTQMAVQLCIDYPFSRSSTTIIVWEAAKIGMQSFDEISKLAAHLSLWGLSGLDLERRSLLYKRSLEEFIEQFKEIV